MKYYIIKIFILKIGILYCAFLILFNIQIDKYCPTIGLDFLNDKISSSIPSNLTILNHTLIKNVESVFEIEIISRKINSLRKHLGKEIKVLITNVT